MLELICTGKTNGEIATILGISPYTVKKYVEKLLLRFGCINRTVLAITAVARGHVKPPKPSHLQNSSGQ